MRLVATPVPLELMAQPLDMFSSRDYRTITANSTGQRICPTCARKLSLDTLKCACGRTFSSPPAEDKAKPKRLPTQRVDFGTLTGRSTGRPNKREGRPIVVNLPAPGGAKPSKQKPIGYLPNGKPIYNLV